MLLVQCPLRNASGMTLLQRILSSVELDAIEAHSIADRRVRVLLRILSADDTGVLSPTRISIRRGQSLSRLQAEHLTIWR